MRSSLVVFALALGSLAGCTFKPASAITKECGCLGGQVCCASGQCAATAAACDARPDAGSPDLSPAPASPEIAFDHTLTSFNDAVIGVTPGPSQTVLVSNVTSHAITISNVSLSSNAPTPAPYKLLASSNCQGDTLVVYASCTIAIEFDPLAVGMVNATLTVDTEGGTHLTMPLSGSGEAGRSSLVTDLHAVDFAPVSARSTLWVHVTNAGSVASGALSATVTGDGRSAFALVPGDCVGSGLRAGGGCDLAIEFTPTDELPRQATLTISDGASAVTLPVTGRGSGPAALHVTGSSDFDPQWIGDASPPSTLQVSNSGLEATGALAVALERDAATKDRFAIVSDGCSGKSLAPRGTCDVAVIFKPVDRGAQSQFLKVSGPRVFAAAVLQGTGRQHATLYTLPPAWVTISTSVPVASATVSLRNIGDEDTAPLAFTLAHADDGMFTVSGCDGRALHAGESCDEQITFKATYAGNFTDTMTATGAIAGPLAVRLTGIFGPHDPFSAAPAAQQQATGSAPYTFKPVVFWNALPMKLAPLTTTLRGAGFSLVSDGCNGASLDKGQTCSVTVRFVPTLTGNFDGQLVVGNNLVSATATMTANAVLPALTFDPSAISFGRVDVGRASAIVLVTLTNVSNRPVSTAATFSDPSFYSAGGDCPDPLPVGGSCSLHFRFGPLAQGGFHGLATFGAAAGTPTLPLDGTGVMPASTRPR